MLKLGVPSKGRLMEDTFRWFADRGISLSRAGSDREYAGRVQGADLSLVLLSAGEIPRELASGRIDLGVTGSDLVREKLAGWRSDVRELALMGFGHADLVLAVPACWRDCENLDDFAAIARQFRGDHGQLHGGKAFIAFFSKRRCQRCLANPVRRRRLARQAGTIRRRAANPQARRPIRTAQPVGQPT